MARFARRVRKRLGLTRVKFARRIDVPYETIRKPGHTDRPLIVVTAPALFVVTRIPLRAGRSWCHSMPYRDESLEGVTASTLRRCGSSPGGLAAVEQRIGRDYPRAGGGTGEPGDRQRPCMGLSPRGRGNRYRPASTTQTYGAIPARAGEPLAIDPLKYLRRQRAAGDMRESTCRFTSRTPSASTISLGASPRVRTLRFPTAVCGTLALSTPSRPSSIYRVGAGRPGGRSSSMP